MALISERLGGLEVNTTYREYKTQTSVKNTDYGVAVTKPCQVQPPAPSTIIADCHSGIFYCRTNCDNKLKAPLQTEQTTEMYINWID